MTLQRLRSRQSDFPPRLLSAESLVLGYLLPFAVLQARLALFVVILLHLLLLPLPRHYPLRVHHYLTKPQQHCAKEVGVLQQLVQFVAKLSCRQLVCLRLDPYFGHVELTRFLEVVILVVHLVVMTALVGPS